jgi:uncharacterized protein (TIGR02466 family)
MKRYLDNLFPTPVGRIETEQFELAKSAGELVLEKMSPEDEQHLQRTGVWCTSDNLHVDPKFKQLYDLVDLEAKLFFEKMLGIDSTDLSMANMWSNVRLNGSKHHIHVHPNSFYSGVIYLSIPDQEGETGGNFFFMSPTPNKFVYADYKTDSALSARSWWYSPKLADLFLFPSWLEHGTDPGKFGSNQRRISLSFNYVLTKCTMHTQILDLEPKQDIASGQRMPPNWPYQ